MIARFYALLLHLYPRAFRAEFGVEMRTVFAQAGRESRGVGATLRLFLRELRDLPGNIIRQYWAAIRKEKITMTSFIQTEEPQPGTWGEAILAGLPHFLMGMLVGIGAILSVDIFPVSQLLSAVLGISLGILVVGILIFAWRRGWPLWSASWYLYGVWVIIVVLGLMIESLKLEDSWRYTNALFLVMIGGLILGYFGLLLKSKMHGLLSVAFLFPLLGLMFVEFVPNPIEGWLAIGLGLLGAGTTASIVRLGKFRLALGLVLGLNLAAGLSIAYISEYKMLDLPPLAPSHVPRFDQFLVNLGLYSIFGLGVVALPFILRGLWNFGKRRFSS